MPTIDDIGTSSLEKNMNKTELAMGKRVEREHKPTVKKIKKNPNMKPQEIYTSIAKDHLNEFPDYYTGLAKMENELKAKKPTRQKTKFEECVDSVIENLGYALILTEAKINISEPAIKKMIDDYIVDRQKAGNDIIKNARKLGMTKSDVFNVQKLSRLDPNLYNKEGMAGKVKGIYEKAVGAKNSLQHTFETFFHDLARLGPSRPSGKIIKQMASSVANAMNGQGNETSLRNLFGHLTIPAKIVLLNLLEQSGVNIPVVYRAEGTNPALVAAVRNAGFNPSYPMHDMYRYIALKVMDEFIGKIPDDNPHKSAAKREIVKAIVGNKQMANSMIDFIKNSKNYKLQSVSLDDYDASKIVLDPNKVKLTDTTYSDTANPSIVSSVEEQLKLLRKLINS